MRESVVRTAEPATTAIAGTRRRSSEGAMAPSLSSSPAAAATAAVVELLQTQPVVAKRRRGNLGSVAGEIRVNEVRYQAFVSPVFFPPSAAQRVNDAEKAAARELYRAAMYDDYQSSLAPYSDIARFFPEVKGANAADDLRARMKASDALRKEALQYRPGGKVTKGGRAGQELRELARLQQKISIAERLDKLTECETETYLVQLKGEETQSVASPSAIMTSASHEFAIVQRLVRKYETPFARLDALAFQEQVFTLVCADIADLVRINNADISSEVTVTAADCWQNQRLIRFMVQKNIPIALRPEDPLDVQAACEAGETHRRLKSIEAARWYALVEASRALDRQEEAAEDAAAAQRAAIAAAAAAKTQTKRKRRTGSTGGAVAAVAAIIERIEPAEHVPKTTASSAARLALVESKDTSGVALDQVHGTAEKLQSIETAVRKWLDDVAGAYDERLDITQAEAIFESGLQLLQYCSIGDQLRALEADITKCQALGERCRTALPLLFTNEAPPDQTERLRIEEVVPWVPRFEELPFEIPEGLMALRAVKQAVTWRETATAAVVENDFVRCQDLMHANAASPLALPGYSDLQGHMIVADWLQKVEKTFNVKRPYSLQFLEELAESVPPIGNLTSRECVRDFLGRRRTVLNWGSRVLDPNCRSILTATEAASFEKTLQQLASRPSKEVLDVIYGGADNVPEDPQLPPEVPPPGVSGPSAAVSLCLPEDLEALAAEVPLLRVTLPQARIIEGLRARFTKWRRRVQRILSNSNHVSEQDFQGAIDEAKGISSQVDVRSLLDELHRMKEQHAVWLKEAHDFLKAYRKALAETDAARACSGQRAQAEALNNSLLHSALAAAPAAADGDAEPVTDKKLLALRKAAIAAAANGPTNRPKLAQLEDLVEREGQSAIRDEAISRELRSILERAHMWKVRVGELLLSKPRGVATAASAVASSISPLQFQRLRLQYILECRSLAIDTDLENQLTDFTAEHVPQENQLPSSSPRDDAGGGSGAADVDAKEATAEVSTHESHE